MTVRFTNRALLIWSLVLTAAFEVVTVLLRFGFRLESTRDTASTVGRLTLGLRIHHSYIGLIIILLACFLWTRFPRAGFWLLATGIGLLLSDLIHHFLVLWVVFGDPQFDLVYP